MAFCRLVLVHSAHNLQWLEAIDNGSMALTLNYDICFLHRASELVSCWTWLCSFLSARSVDTGWAQVCLQKMLQHIVLHQYWTLATEGEQTFWPQSFKPRPLKGSGRTTSCHSQSATAYLTIGPIGGTKPLLLKLLMLAQHVRISTLDGLRMLRKSALAYPLIKTRFNINIIWMH